MARVLKVILETCLLNTEEKLRASEIAIQAGADFIKTSTGFSTGGATPADVALIRGVAGARCGVKALRRHPHTGRRARLAGGRREPHRRVGVCGDCAGAGGGVRRAGTLKVREQR